MKGVLLAPYAGKFSTFSEVVIDRYGLAVGAVATFMSLVGSILWASAQYKAIVELTESVGAVPEPMLEPSVAVGLLTWTLVGGLVADVWLDAISMMAVAPCVLAVGAYAAASTPTAAIAAELEHAAGALRTTRAANTFAVGLLGNLFTEELAGRVLLARSPRDARLSCFSACGIFTVVGLGPAALGLWARSMPGLLTGADGETMCDDGGKQDQILATALGALLPQGLQSCQKALFVFLIVESLNTVDTSILMCAQVMERQAGRVFPAWSGAAWLHRATAVVSLALVVGVSKLGDSVWDLAEQAAAAVGAPLTITCAFLPLARKDDSKAILTGMVVSQALYTWLSWGAEKDADGMPFVWAVAAGIGACVICRR